MYQCHDVTETPSTPRGNPLPTWERADALAEKLRADGQTVIILWTETGETAEPPAPLPAPTLGEITSEAVARYLRVAAEHAERARAAR